MYWTGGKGEKCAKSGDVSGASDTLLFVKGPAEYGGVQSAVEAYCACTDDGIIEGGCIPLKKSVWKGVIGGDTIWLREGISGI